jgi:hypothetical protein
MNKLIWIVVIIVFVFLLTYDPKSGRLEKYITTPQVAQVAPPSAKLAKCPEDRYYELQFNEKAPPGACAGTPVEFLGAVIQA